MRNRGINKYMIVSVDAVERSIRSSEHFPTIIEVNETDGLKSPTEILEGVFYPEDFRPRANKSYYLIPMEDGVKITFRPLPRFEVEVTRI